MKKVFRDRRAISSIIATIMIFGLIMLGIAIGAIFLLPIAQQTQEENNYIGIFAGLTDIDAAIKEIMHGSSKNATATIRFAPSLYGAIESIVSDNISLTFSNGTQTNQTSYSVGSLQCTFFRLYSRLSSGQSVNLLDTSKTDGTDVFWWESTDADRDATDLNPTNIILRRESTQTHYLSFYYGIEIQTTTYINPNIKTLGGLNSTHVEVNIIVTILQSMSPPRAISESPLISVILTDYSTRGLYKYTNWADNPNLSFSASTDSEVLASGISANSVLVREIIRVFTINW
ncbi:MAG: hypothetical protein ACFFC7_14320 [Candidatus Hermodarchaeota archaeon]